MRAALWLMALFAVAVVSALFAGNNHGTVTFYWHPHRAIWFNQITSHK